MKNKLSDLHNHLFAQIERLGDESLSTEALENELKRSRAITQVSKAPMISLTRLKLKIHDRTKEHDHHV